MPRRRAHSRVERRPVPRRPSVWVVVPLILLALTRQSAGQWEAYPAVYELDQWNVDWSPTHGLKVEAHRIVRVNRSSGADVGRIRI